jgi:deoxycytidylate deaminase
VKKEVIDKTIKIAHKICPKNREAGLRAPHIAFLIRKNKIVKIGWNKNKTHPATKEFSYLQGNSKYEEINVGIHAEFDVLNKYGRDKLHDYELIVLRVDGEGKLNNSRPCYGCSQMIKKFEIKDVYYSNSFGGISKF